MMASAVTRPSAGDDPTGIVCADCGQRADAQRRFCGECGARLWEPCLACEAPNSVAQRYCCQCGAELQRLLDAALEEIGQRLERAALLEQEGKLLEAAECLAEVPDNDHSQLAPRIDQSRRRHAELSATRRRAIDHMEAVADQARRLRDERRFAAARAAIEKVPASLRNESVRSLVRELDETLRQIGSLRSEVQQALRQGHADLALSKVEQLLQLQPHDEDVRRLGERLRQHRHRRETVLAGKLLKQARLCLAENDYEGAGRYLEQLPQSIARKDIPLAEAARERVWLARQLKLAPYADKTLLAIAGRLVKLQPGDAWAQKQQREMDQRLAEADRRTGQRIVSWARPTDQPVLGAPVEPIVNLPDVHWDRDNPRIAGWTSRLRHHLVSFGLALHGLGEARLDMELKPRDATRWLGRLSALPRRRAPAAWGLDFGASGLKVVRLVREKHGLAVDCSAIIPCPPEQLSDGTPGFQPLSTSALEAFLADCHPNNEPLVVGFPGTQTLGRFFTLPPLKRKRLRAALEFEVRSQIPLPLEEVVYSGHVWVPPRSGGSGTTHVAVAAAKKDHVDLWTRPMVESNKCACCLQCECVALANALLHIHRRQFEAIQPSQALALVDVGDLSTNVVVVSPAHGLWFRAIHRGARSLDHHLVCAFGLTWPQAESLRRNWLRQKSLSCIDAALQSGLDELTRAVRRVIDAYHGAGRGRISRIYVVGGGSDQFGLLREWSCPGELGVRDASHGGQAPVWDSPSPSGEDRGEGERAECYAPSPRGSGF